ncbi:SGNH/GDSL hydrolase family protein [Streptomyces sp. NPDC093252]|uniref:SGNH/GDSL hydrolase family protein n=1 Tax=Streptomyces sp. NPDC093252 TaxID=3154980 RepID=UPI003417D5EA
MDSPAALAPQLAQYEKFAMSGVHWQPYVMYFNQPDYRSPVLTTDSRGFRLSHGLRDVPHSLGDHLPEGPVSLLMGGSSAFGFGAGSDRTTLASLLGRETGTPWLNLAAPAFNSTQEVLLFLLHRHQLPQIRDVVIFSGLNNLVLSALPGADRGFGQFFFSGEFYGELSGAAVRRGAVAGIARPRSGLRRLLSRSGPPAQPEPPLDQRVATAAGALRRDLDRLLELLAPTGARVRFALQPTLPWSRKKPSAEESVLLREDGSLWSTMWAGFRTALTEEAHERYAEETARVCRERGVDFLDLSAALASHPDRDGWLFVDPVHLNDRGNALATTLLCAAFGIGAQSPEAAGAETLHGPEPLRGPAEKERTP